MSLNHRQTLQKEISFRSVTGYENATTQATLSRNGFAIEVSCCVKTQTDKPACLPENARLINLLVRFLRSFDTAQSSSIINVFLPEKKSSQIPSKSFISSTLLASGGKHDKTFVSFGESSVSFIFRISRTNQYDQSNTWRNEPLSWSITYLVLPQLVGPVMIQ